METIDILQEGAAAVLLNAAIVSGAVLLAALIAVVIVATAINLFIERG
jgi:hypothetical protein